MRRKLLLLSIGIFSIIAMLVILWTILLLARTFHVKAQTDPLCSQFTTFPSYANNPVNCSAYWKCEASDEEPQLWECPEGFNFDDERLQCSAAIDFPCEDPDPNNPVPICSQFTDFPWFLNNPIRCSAYWVCAASNEQPTNGECDEGQNFNEDIQACSLAVDFPCEDPVDPDPVDPDPVDPDPVDPDPVDPDPVDPDPVDPDPVDPDPVDPDPPITRPPPQRDVCESVPDGTLVNDPTRCQSYFECTNGVGLPRQCSMGWNFNEELQICDSPHLTPCSNEDFECPSSFWGISRWEVIGSCTEYNFCFEGQHIVRECAPGLHFDSEISLCALEEEAGCTRDRCPLIGDINAIVTYPFDDDCEQYYMCHGGNLELQKCAPRTHWNQERQRCERPADAECEPTEAPPITIECPVGSGVVNVPHPTICRKFFICFNEVPVEQECSSGLLFDVIDLTCKLASSATCADGATRRSTKQINY